LQSTVDRVGIAGNRPNVGTGYRIRFRPALFLRQQFIEPYPKSCREFFRRQAERLA